VDDAIDANAAVADAIVSLATSTMGLPTNPPPQPAGPLDWRGTAKPSDHSKAHSTLRQFYRDWTSEGFNNEVKPLLDLILNDLRSHLPAPTQQSQPSLLLPGAGLARLLLELTLQGYHTTGNEISYHQLLASNYILNSTPHANAHTIHPFATTFTNVVTRKAQLRAFTIPDIHPGIATAEARAAGQLVGEMDMAAGDLILSFGPPNNASNVFDAVVTAYFIDTAPNLFRYIDTIRHTLRPDGVWINIGPLLWHFDDRAPQSSSSPQDSSDDHHTATDANVDTGIAEPGSFELSHEEVLLLVEANGFKIESQELCDGQNGDQVLEDESHPPTTGLGAYIQDPASMLQNRYRCAHWVARKI
jgi:carnosine N-methyltransferase